MQTNLTQLWTDTYDKIGQAIVSIKARTHSPSYGEWCSLARQ
ncbi:MAG: hypothetical protein R2688_05600 [Fimbriimonadaceae bacterium]